METVSLSQGIILPSDLETLWAANGVFAAALYRLGERQDKKGERCAGGFRLCNPYRIRVCVARREVRDSAR